MIKRFIDIFLSLIILLAASPIIIIILLLVSLSTSQFPVIIQKRSITIEKRRIKVYKIRTIKSSQEFLKLEVASSNIFFKENFREYVPGFCALLRKNGMDEILQLINVIKGEMSIVGPRPLLESDLKIMQTMEPEFYLRRTDINSLPGITGYWQVFGDRKKGSQSLVELDEAYEKQKSFFFDAKIMLKSILIILTASHSDSIL